MTMAWHKRFWIRLHWPTWVVYLPAVVSHLGDSRGRFTSNANVNPGMAMGGLYGASKITLDPIPEDNKPKTLSFAPGTDVDAVMSVHDHTQGPSCSRRCRCLFWRNDVYDGLTVVARQDVLQAATSSRPFEGEAWARRRGSMVGVGPSLNKGGFFEFLTCAPPPNFVAGRKLVEQRGQSPPIKLVWTWACEIRPQEAPAAHPPKRSHRHVQGRHSSCGLGRPHPCARLWFEDFNRRPSPIFEP